MGIADAWPVVREGVWLYAGTSPVQVRILRSKECWGTGDHEDEESMRETHPVECYFLTSEMAGSPGTFCNLVPNLPSLGEAISHAEARFPGIAWRIQD